MAGGLSITYQRMIEFIGVENETNLHLEREYERTILTC